MSKVLHSNLIGPRPIAVAGEGIYIIDQDGRRYIDGSCGAAITCLGYDNQEVMDAIAAQLRRLPFIYTKDFSAQAMEELGTYMIDTAPEELDYAYFVTGGSEAIEAAVIIARQYFIEIKQPQRTRIVGRRSSYHGCTLGTLSIGDNPRGKDFKPLMLDVDHISPCHPYRQKEEGETDLAYGERIADELESVVARHGPDTVMAFVAETISGGSLGAVPPVPGYFRRVRDICDRYGILLILDEVMCGLGRTGTYYAYTNEGIRADMVAVAKGLAAGYQPVGAVLLQARIHDAIKAGSGTVNHRQSFVGHATACAAALATQKVLLEGGVLENVRRQSDTLDRALESRFSNHPHVGDMRGRGLLRAIEFVESRATKAPFASSKSVGAHIAREALKRGLHIYSRNASADQSTGDFVLLAPPYVINETEVDTMVDILADAVDAAIGTV